MMLGFQSTPVEGRAIARSVWVIISHFNLGYGFLKSKTNHGLCFEICFFVIKHAWKLLLDLWIKWWAHFLVVTGANKTNIQKSIRINSPKQLEWITQCPSLTGERNQWLDDKIKDFFKQRNVFLMIIIVWWKMCSSFYQPPNLFPVSTYVHH